MVGGVVVVVVVVLDDVGGAAVGGGVGGGVLGGGGATGVTSPGFWFASGVRLGGADAPNGTGAFGPLSTYTGVPRLSVE